jgi:predicted protein tyrosine phosphatase
MSDPYIYIFSLDQAEKFLPGPDDICISIRSPGQEPAKLSEDFLAVLRLYFSDLAGVEEPYLDDEAPLSVEDADRIVAFVAEHHATAQSIVIHCEGGVSRSVAVALAISRSFFGYWAFPSWYRARERRDLIVHNREVFDCVCAAYQRKLGV